MPKNSEVEKDNLKIETCLVEVKIERGLAPMINNNVCLDQVECVETFVDDDDDDDIPEDEVIEDELKAKREEEDVRLEHCKVWPLRPSELAISSSSSGNKVGFILLFRNSKLK